MGKDSYAAYPTAMMMEPSARASLVWRRGWGSNPRSRCQDSSFRDQPESGLEEDQSLLTADDSREGSQE